MEGQILPRQPRSLFVRLEEATAYPTYEEYQEPIRYTYPMKPEELVSFRRRWSRPGRAITQPDLANWLGMQERQINRYEKGEAPISPVVVLALCEMERRLVDRMKSKLSDSLAAPQDDHDLS